MWALHTPIPVVDNSRDRGGSFIPRWAPVSRHLSPHPRRGFVSVGKGSLSSLSPTENDPQDRGGHSPPIKGGPSGHATDKSRPGQRRYRRVDEGGRLLALRWLSDGRTPAWAARFTPRGWAGLLAKPAAHGWTAEDINVMIREWVTVGGNYLPPEPYRPHGLLGAIFKQYAADQGLEHRPAAAAQAQAAAVHAADLAAMHTRRQVAATAQPATAEHRTALRTGWRSISSS